MRTRLTLALPKGRMLDPSIALLRRIGLSCRGLTATTRKLLFEDAKTGVRLVIVRATDVPTYVEYGAADAGIVGKDVLLEQERDVYEPVDLRVGACRLVVAGPAVNAEASPWPAGTLRVATKYPRITEHYFSEKGLSVEIIRLSGNIELAALIGLADRVVDLVTTGRTLRENNLVIHDVIASATARLIVNRASLKTKVAAVTGLIDRIQQATKDMQP